MTTAMPVRSDGPAVADAGPGSVVDIDLHGLVGIRLIGAGAGDRRAVERQFGPAGPPSSRPPDITISYVDEIAGAATERLLGAREYAFCDDGFVVLRGRNKRAVRVLLPMESIGGPCELVCEHGVGRVPLLVAIVNLTLGANGALAVHASAFTLGDRGVLTMGWSKGGKTEALLAALTRGGSYVGDEWIHLHGRRQMSGIVEPMRVWDTHLSSLPDLRRRVPPLDRARMGALGLARPLGRLRHPVGQRVAALAAGRRFVDLTPEQLVDEPTPLTPRTASLDQVVLVTSGAGPSIEVRPIDAAEVADRMRASLAYERAPLDAAYEAWRFAFPHLQNPLLDTVDERERAALHHFLAGVEVCEVRHPYPVDLSALGDAIDEIVRVGS